jgi:hypothetical protein
LKAASTATPTTMAMTRTSIAKARRTRLPVITTLVLLVPQEQAPAQEIHADAVDRVVRVVRAALVSSLKV